MSDIATTPPPEEPPKEHDLEIHKPKPVHSWRELLTEIGVIVIGVLLALTGEQTVEWIHWHYEVTQAEYHLRADAESILAGMVERLEIQKCQDRRLTLIRDKLLSSGTTWTAIGPFYTSGPPAGSTYAHPMRPWPTTSWSNAVTSTAATHLPEDRLSAYAQIFAAAERVADDQTREHEDSSELNVLGSSIVLTPDQKVGFLRLIEAERARNRLIGYEAINTLRHFRALGLNIEKSRQAVRDQLPYQTCVANHLN